MLVIIVIKRGWIIVIKKKINGNQIQLLILIKKMRVRKKLSLIQSTKRKIITLAIKNIIIKARLTLKIII